MIKRTIRLLCATAAAIGIMVWYSGRAAEPQALRCVLPTVTDASDTLRVQGTLTERSRTNLVTTRSATVERVLYSQGDTVYAGQLLALLKPLRTQDDPTETLYQLVSGLDLSALYGSGSGGADISCQGRPEDQNIYLFAPTSGIILENHLTEGGTVSAYGLCAVVADTSEMHISAQVPEETVRYLKDALPCIVTVEALELEGLHGTLSSVAPYASQTSVLGQTPEVKTGIEIRMEEPAGLLPGYTATAIFTLQQYENILLLPYACLGQDEAGEYVLAVRDNRICRVAVTTGQEFSEGVRILDGIAETDRILLDPDLSLVGKSVNFT